MIKVRVCVSAEKIPDFVSWRIMRRTKFHGSHIFLIYKDEIFEAAEHGVERVPVAGGLVNGRQVEPLLENHRLVEDIELVVPCSEEDFYKWFKGVEGITYSHTQWGGFVFPAWCRWLFKNGRQGAICSEFVCWFLIDLMKWAQFDDSSEFISPGEVVAGIKKAVGLTA